LGSLHHAAVAAITYSYMTVERIGRCANSAMDYFCLSPNRRSTGFDSLVELFFLTWTNLDTKTRHENDRSRGFLFDATVGNVFTLRLTTVIRQTHSSTLQLFMHSSSCTQVLNNCSCPWCRFRIASDLPSLGFT
jgi:hypothetical protein